MKKRQRHTLMLTVTEACNLRCSYCYEKGKGSLGTLATKMMSFSTATKAVSEMFATLDPENDELEIQFHGGEPFLAFDLIRDVCEWIWCTKWEVPYIVHATTNGTILSSETKDWLAKNHERFCVGVSLDGTREMHDRNRSNSFSDIDISFHLSFWPQQPAKMTLSAETLPTLSEGVIFLTEAGFKIQCGFAFGIDWDFPDNPRYLHRELGLLVDYYLRNSERPVCELLQMNMAAVGATQHRSHTESASNTKWCGIGDYMRVIDVNGRAYPCHLFMPFSTGQADVSTNSNWDFTDTAKLQDPYCADCCLLPVCPTCYASSTLVYGAPHIRSRALCRLTRIRALASSKMQAERLLLDGAQGEKCEREPIDLYLTVQGIRAVQETFGRTTDFESLDS